MKEFKDFIEKIRGRRKMFVQGDKFIDLCNFIIGYSCGIDAFTKQKPDLTFNNWLMDEKIKKNTNTYWPDNIYKMADNNDALAEKILFDLLDKFFKSMDKSIS